MTCLVDGCPLRDALVMTAPDDVGALGEIEDTFHGFPKTVSTDLSIRP